MVQFIRNLLTFKKIACLVFAFYSLSVLASPKAVKPKDIEVRSEKLLLDYDKGIATYFGDVKVRYDGTNIYCDKAEIFYSAKKNSQKQGSLAKGQKKMLLDVIRFYNNVVIESNGNTAYSDYGVFTKSNNLVVLEKNVRLKDKKGYLVGSKLLYNVRTKKMNLVNNKGNKRVRAVIND